MRKPEELRTAAVVSLAVLLTMTTVADAKRGCSAFGHSCFGGHGKRMDPGVQSSAPEEVVYPGLQDVVFTAPRSDSLLEALRRQQHELAQTQDDLPASLPQRQMNRDMNLQPFLRQWLQAYRSSQEVHQNNI